MVLVTDQCPTIFSIPSHLAHMASPSSCCLPANVPGDLLDANFLALLFIVVIPFTLKQVNARESGSRVNTLGFPVTLD
jgi:hypothetical protein